MNKPSILVVAVVLAFSAIVLAQQLASPPQPGLDGTGGVQWLSGLNMRISPYVTSRR